MKIISFLTIMGIGAGVQAAEPVFYPTKQQTTEQMQQDKIYCQGWAQEQAKASDTAAAKTPEHSGVKTAAKGAAIGAAGGAIGGDAGKGAAIGEVVGGVAGRRNQNRAEAGK